VIETTDGRKNKIFMDIQLMLENCWNAALGNAVIEGRKWGKGIVLDTKKLILPTANIDHFPSSEEPALRRSPRRLLDRYWAEGKG
jgi:hypothetical protein